MRYLESIALVNTYPCLAEPGKIVVVGEPAHSLEEVIPYLATLPSILSYNPSRCVLTFRRSPGFMTIKVQAVTITQVKDTDEAMHLLAALTEAINEVWDHREKLVAVTKPKRVPGHLDIWALLPRTNCRECGEATCMAFAVGLIQQQRNLDECPMLQSDSRLREHRAALEAML